MSDDTTTTKATRGELTPAERLMAYEAQLAADPTNPFRRTTEGWAYHWFDPTGRQDLEAYRDKLHNRGWQPMNGPRRKGKKDDPVYVAGVAAAEIWGRDPETVEAARKLAARECYQNDTWVQIQRNRIKRGAPFLPDYEAPSGR